jgi:hypothetical protein
MRQCPKVQLSQLILQYVLVEAFSYPNTRNEQATGNEVGLQLFADSLYNRAMQLGTRHAWHCIDKTIAWTFRRTVPARHESLHRVMYTNPDNNQTSMSQAFLVDM